LCGVCRAVCHAFCWHDSGGRCAKCRTLATGTEPRTAPASLNVKAVMFAAAGAVLLIVVAVAAYKFFRRPSNGAEQFFQEGRALENTESGEACLLSSLDAGNVADIELEGLEPSKPILPAMNLDKQSECYARAIELKPDYADAHFEMARVKIRQRLATEAMSHVRKVIEMRPGDARARFYCGLLLEHCKDFEGAVREYRKALELRPDLPDAERYLAMLCRRAGTDDNAGAAACFQNAVRRDPADVALCVSYSGFLLERSKFTEAVVVLEECAKRHTDDPLLKAATARAYISAEQPAKALEILRAMDASAGTSQAVRRLNGIALYGSGQAEAALAALGPFAERIADSEVQTARGGACFLLGRGDDAKRILEDVVARASKPGNSREALILLARIALRNEQFDEAISSIAGVLSDAPDDFGAALWLCRANVAAGRLQEAERALQRAGALRGGDGRLVAPKAACARFAGRASEALALCRAAIAGGGADPEVSLELAITFEEVGMLPEAIDAYRACEGSWCGAEAYGRLGMLCEAIGAKDLAAEAYRQCLVLEDYGVFAARAARFLNLDMRVKSSGQKREGPGESVLAGLGVVLCTPRECFGNRCELLTIGFQALSYMMAVFCESNDGSQAPLKALGTSLKNCKLQASEGDDLSEDPVKVDDFSAARLDLACVSAGNVVQALRADIAAHDAAGVFSEDLRAELAARGKALASTRDRLVHLRAYTASMVRLLDVLGRADLAAAEGAKRTGAVMETWRAQEILCDNSMELVCSDICAIAGLLAVIGPSRACKGVESGEITSIVRRLERNDPRLGNVFDQIQNGLAVVSDLLAMVLWRKSVTGER
jgi:Flp pilus assembly protein TadD